MLTYNKIFYFFKYIVGCKNKKKYESYKSNSSKEINSIVTNSPDYQKNFLTKKDEVLIKFGTGDIKSHLYRDKVCLGYEKNNICVDNFLFLSAFDLSENPFKDVDFDGIIGLGFSDLSISPDSNFLTSLLKSRKISNKIFAFYFKKNFFPFESEKKLHKKTKIPYKYDKKIKENLSELVIGGIDFNRIQGEIYFFEVISRKYWEVKIDNIFYGNIKLPFCENVECTAIIDTGTSTLGVSDNFLSIFDTLTNLNRDCSNLKTLKSLIFQIGGIYFELDPKDYVLKLKTDGINKIVFEQANDKVEEK
jgi:hypothetical protein